MQAADEAVLLSEPIAMINSWASRWTANIAEQQTAYAGPPRFGNCASLQHAIHKLARVMVNWTRLLEYIPNRSFRIFLKHFEIFLAGGRWPPDPPVFDWGCKATPNLPS